MESMKIKIFDFALIFTTIHDFIYVEIHCNNDSMLMFYVLGSFKVGLCNHSDKIIKKCEQNIGRALPIFT